MRRRSAHQSSEAREWASAFASKKRSWLLAAALNLGLLLGLVGLPYLRGQQRARAAWQAYDRLASCLYEGTLRSPRAPRAADEASAFASQALGNPKRLGHCVAQFDELAPADDLLILPPLKRAEAALREATRVARLELSALRVEPGMALSSRPLRALVQLRTMLQAHSSEAGLLESPSITSEARLRAPALPTPGRIPLFVGADAVLSLWGSDDTLHAIGLDRTGLSYLRMRDEVEVAARLARPKLLRDLLLVDEQVYLVYGTRDERCRQLGGCAGKSMGIVQATLPLTSLPTPRWLGAHLAERADRGLRLSERTLEVVARTDAASELRTFARATLSEPLEGAMPPLAAQQHRALHEGRSVLSTSATLELDTNGTKVVLHRDGTAIAALPKAGEAWLVACGTGFAFGTERSIVLGEHERVYAPVAIALGRAVDERDRSKDRITCSGASAAVLDSTQRLQLIDCTEAGCALRQLARDVGSYAALKTPRGWLLAYAGAGNGSQIRVRTANETSATEERIPAACWSPTGGMCGAPALALLGSRLVLAARDGTDLVALESPDFGQSFQPLYGAEPSVPRELAEQVMRASLALVDSRSLLE